MKVYEIVVEAPNVRRGILDPEITDVEPKEPSKTKAAAPKSASGTNAFSQMANQLGGTSSTGGTTTATPTGQTHTANPNNPNNPAKPSASNTSSSTNNTSNTTASPGSKPPSAKELQKKLDRAKQEKIKKITEQKVAGLFANPLVQAIGRSASIILPVLDWIEQMATVNEMWRAGHIDGVTAQGYRASYTATCMTAMATNYAAFVLMAKSSAKIVTALRTVMAGVPGPGWIAWTVTSLAQWAFFELLNTKIAQDYICNFIMSRAWPVADWVGAQGELGVVDAADKLKDWMRDAGKKPGAITPTDQQATPTANKQPASAPPTPSKGQGAQPSAPSGSGDRMVTGDELMKQLGL